MADAGVATSHMSPLTAAGTYLWCHLHVDQFFAAGQKLVLPHTCHIPVAYCMLQPMIVLPFSFVSVLCCGEGVGDAIYHVCLLLPFLPNRET